MKRMAERESIQEQGGGSGRAYRAFLLRCWQEPGAGSGSQPAWRFSLVWAEGEGEQRGFASLEDLGEYLRQELEMAE
jgi:hypothetical protein